MTEKVQQIVAMGYSEAEAEQALKVAGGDMEQAVGFLLLSASSRGGFEDVSAVSDSKPAAQPRPVLSPDVAIDVPAFPSYARERSLADIHVPVTKLSSTISEMTMPSFRNNRVSGGGSSNISEKKIDELMEMGYSIDEARQALKVSDGDIDQAVGFLLMGNSSRGAFMAEVTDSFSITQNSDDAKLAASLYLQQEEERLTLQGQEKEKNRPEYTMYNTIHKGGGKNVPKMVVTTVGVREEGAAPFCSCVAARNFLDGGMVNAAYLNAIVLAGLALFQKAGEDINYNVDKVMLRFGKTQNLGLIAPKREEGVFQPEDLQNENGLRNLLLKIRNEQEDGWEVTILEVDDISFCICLPPKGTANKFWLMEMLARAEFKTTGAYARVHTSLLQLEESLEYVMKIKARKTRQEILDFRLFVVAIHGNYARP